MLSTLPTCVVADDHAIVREAVVIRLEEESLATVVGEAKNGLEAVELIRLQRPEIALIDLRMPAATGIEVAQAVVAEQLPTMVIIYSACIGTSMVEAAFAAGARGYIAKEASTDIMAVAIRSVLAGNEFVNATRPAVKAPPPVVSGASSKSSGVVR
ncbi:MAG: response regulator transcription factor [Thermoleophilia bacterium]|nr:response regulator transcription factor [Thermoleophilia bacterium]